MTGGWLGLLVVIALLSATGHLMFKLAAVGERRLWDRLRDVRFLVGCAAFGIAPVLTFLAARHIDYSLLYAATALNFPLVMLLSRLILKEPLDRSKLLGVAGILFGLWVFVWG